jgi:hypothetical protein
MKHASPEAREALIEAVKTQVKENNPPEAKQTFLRLLGEGILEEDVYIYLREHFQRDISGIEEKLVDVA